MNAIKKTFILFLFLILSLNIFSQEYSLTNSGTLYDSFENPGQSAFELNESRKYSFNFLFPANHSKIFFKGDANESFKTILFKRTLNFEEIPNAEFTKFNNFRFNNNTYLVLFKIFNTVKYQKELGFSIQYRTFGNLNLNNQTITLFNNNLQLNNSNYDNTFNGKGNGQAYSQFSVTYRQNYDKKWAWGGKISVLNGIAYADGEVHKSSLLIDRNRNILTASFIGNGFSSIDENPRWSSILPNFKNPGFSISVGSSYKSKSGYYLSGHIKDLGFIYWRNNSKSYQLDDTLKVYNAINSENVQLRLLDRFGSFIDNNSTNDSRIKPVQTKIELFASKKIDFYTPNIIISKNVFNNEFVVASLNNFKHKIWNIGFNGIYSHIEGFNFGSQVMIQSPNVEFYLGSERLFPTSRFVRGFLNDNPSIGNNPSRADFYMGFSLKFGRKMQHFSMADDMPDYDEVRGPRKPFRPFEFLKRKNKTSDNNRSN